MLNLLYNNDYQVKLIGNPFMDCDSFDEKLCSYQKKKFYQYLCFDTLSSSPFGYFRENIAVIVKSDFSVRYKIILWKWCDR